ncbi:NAD(P)H-dependent oxidoreductase [Azospirillum halopraeferens]|uniref:NAD(P)H-dependent oxidoreductase n=1 Tax=Azospirillum halopraeferens TaxID=34010 RepID=UPI00041259F6|nr:NAD(P)H-dependent oxidoreductase [Azospirillum halopraeferens]
MRVQAILAHPLPDSFAAAVHRTAVAALRTAGHEVVETDLYAEGFEPALTAAERAGYFSDPYDAGAVGPLVERLRWSQALVLTFPHWWFDQPAILKGWFDRVWAPGVAFRHDREGGRIVPLLTGLERVTVLTSFGSPWWLAELYMRNPARRILKRGVLAACAPRARLRYLALYDMDRATARRRAAHLAAVETAVVKP